MNFFDDISNLPDEALGHVIVIGNFDGVHKGHQALLARAKEMASQLGAKVGVLTFEPHPRRLFRPDEPPARLTPAALKVERLRAEGVDYVFALPFDWNFASQSADDFIARILMDGLRAQHVVVGYDFRFGQMRKGAPAMIAEAGIETTIVEEVGEDLSSSAIRKALRHGEIDKANNMLGWDWEICGTVIHGDKRGREIGFPTANVALGDVVHPAYGIYAARVKIQGEDKWYNAAINIGIRPMFELSHAQMEVYIFDFDRDIYDKELRVCLVKRLRSEAKFASLDALIAQMNEDCDIARKLLE